MTSSELAPLNGVDRKALFETIAAVKAAPELASFKFRVRNSWVEGGHNLSAITGFFGTGAEIGHASPFVLHNDEPPVLLGNDEAPNPVEYVLHALAGCLTTTLVYHAAARGLRVDADNARDLLHGYELVIDGTDNFETRRVVALAAEGLGLPLVSGAVSMWDGQVTVFLPGGRRFADLYPVTPDAADVPSCEAVGVLGAVTGVIGTLMAMEAIKLITGAGDVLAGRLMLYDGRAARFTELEF